MAIDRNRHLHVVRLEMALSIVEVHDGFLLVRGHPLRVPRGIRRCSDHCTAARHQVRGLLARHEREFPRGGGLRCAILMLHILLPRILLPLILVADERNETANSGDDKVCHVHGWKNIH